eukprot:4275313-Lingulodinium_polyedra.AAC.1
MQHQSVVLARVCPIGVVFSKIVCSFVLGCSRAAVERERVSAAFDSSGRLPECILRPRSRCNVAVSLRRIDHPLARETAIVWHMVRCYVEARWP